MVKCLAQGHKCHGRDSNPHSAANTRTWVRKARPLGHDTPHGETLRPNFKCCEIYVPPVLFRINYYSIEIPHGVTAISLTYHPHHAKLQVLPIRTCIQLLVTRTHLQFTNSFRDRIKIGITGKLLETYVLWCITSEPVPSWPLTFL